MMRKEILPQAERYTRRNKRHSAWQKIVTVLGCAVVFCTTYALILPGITLEKSCDLTEHTHSEACYTQIVGPEVPVLSCGVESLNVHTHTEGCTNEAGEVVCGTADYVAHTHGDSCYSGDSLVCQIPERKLHTHEESCFTVHTHDDTCKTSARGDLTCTLAENDHVHDASCDGLGEANVCGLEETEGHGHNDSCYELREVYACGQEEGESHTHDETCGLTMQNVLICGQEEVEAHAHSDLCKQTVQVCGQEPHAHTDACYAVVTQVTCGLEEGAQVKTCTEEEYKLHTHDAQLCYTHTQDEEGNEVTVLTCPVLELLEHVHADDCFTMGLTAAAQPLNCALEESEEHTHGAECYSAEPALTCTQQEPHGHDENCYSPDGTMTCTLKEILTHTHGDGCYDENGALICTQEEVQGHTHSAMCYGYWNLTCELEEHKHTTECDPLTGLSENDRTSIAYVISLIDQLPTYDELEAKIAEYEELENYNGEEAYLTEVYTLAQDAYRVYSYLDETEKTLVSNAHKLMELEFIWSVMPIASDAGIDWVAPNAIQTASTKDFIEVNLYNYNSLINTNYFWQDPDDKTVDNDYPGFQWNGGAYVNPDYTYDIQMVDFIDFGNSIVADGEYGGSNITTNGKSYNAVGPANKNKTNINKIESNDTWGTTNRPIGMSLNSSITDTSEDVLKRVLTPAGEIMTLDGSNNGEEGLRLGYLFNDASPAVTKVNTESVDGLFQYNEETGMYSYNSRLNHAQYDADDYDNDNITDEFIVFNEIITPNFIVYPFGNFLPFNKITSSSTSTQVGKITSGLLDNYLDVISDYHLKDATGSSQVQLRTMLHKYRTEVIDNRTGSGGSNAYRTWDAKDAIEDYFLGGAGDNWDDKPSSNTSLITDTLLNKMYNIDFDVATDFWFSMTMEMDFYQPRDGMTGKDKENDGIGDYEMVFDFSGDDDVWVYVDGVLFLDLTGIHRHVGGKIDFHNGIVQYYALDPETTGDTTKLYKTYTFKEILTEAYKYKYRNTYSGTELTNYVTTLVNDALDFSDTANGRFKDYTIHNFKFYYIERGSGSSVCRMNFNFPQLEQNTVTVKKTLDKDNKDILALGNPDFAFQVMDVDDKLYEEYNEDNVITAEEEKRLKSAKQDGSPLDYFVKADWAYKLTDVDGTILQDMIVEEIYPDGTVKTLKVYKGAYKDPDKYPAEQKAQIDAENAANLVRTETWSKDIATGQYTVHVTDHPDAWGNVLTLTTDSNGIFKLKAGQSAQFVGITENWGKYFVRELMTTDLVAQYGEGNISVSTNVTTSYEEADSGETIINETKYIGFDSPIYDIATHSVEFSVSNKVTTDKLGTLSLTKEVEAYEPNPDQEFIFYVELDGEKLDVGTPYVVTTEVADSEANAVFNGKYVTVESRTVEAEGQIKIKADQTATIGTSKITDQQLVITPIILAGAEFKVYEAAESAEGYNVTYTVADNTAKDVENIESEKGVSGQIMVDTTVAMVATNSERGTTVTIPGKKSVYYSASDKEEDARIYSFNLVQVADKNGNALPEGTSAYQTSATAKVQGNAVTNFGFTLAYLNSQFQNIPVNPTESEFPVELSKFYYKITEAKDNTGYTIIDPSVYVAEVTVSLNADGTIKAELTNMWKDKVAIEEAAKVVAFTNTLTGDLSVKKEVEGGSSSIGTVPFTFKLTLATGSSGVAVPTEIKDSDGDTHTANEGKFTFTLTNGQTITFIDLPHGMQWTVEEVFENAGYLTTNTVSGAGVTDTPAENETSDTIEEDTIATGTIAASATEVTLVTFTNQVLYTLPETGGTGTTVYTMGGLILVTAALFALTYSSKRRKGAF